MIKKIYAVWVYVRNLGESRKFYEEILGLKFKLQDGHWIEFDLGGTSFGLLERHPHEILEPQKTRVMFQVDNIDIMSERLKVAGITILGLRNETYGKLLSFQDVNGHTLELFEPK